MKSEGGFMTLAAGLFLGSFLMLVLAGVVYMMKDDTTSNKWAEQTKGIVAENEKLRAEWKDAIKMVEDVCSNHGTLAEELQRQKVQVDKLEFAFKNSTTKLPETINFTVVERRKVVREVDAPAAMANGSAGNPTPTEKKVIKKIKKQLQGLSQ